MPGSSGTAPRLRRFGRHAHFVRESVEGRAEIAGTTRAVHVVMAAVFALVFVPAVTAVVCMFGMHGTPSFGTVAAAAMFFALIVGLLAGLFRLTRELDDEKLA